jgi:hypothetical protein
MWLPALNTDLRAGEHGYYIGHTGRCPVVGLEGVNLLAMGMNI